MSVQSADVATRERSEEYEQYSLPWALLLHLLPGAALTLFIVFAGPVVESLGMPVVFALFLGIAVVIVPLELGYLLWHARRTTGTFSLHATVNYRERLPAGRIALIAFGLFVWFTVFLVASAALLDEWLADRVFGWMPEAILQFSEVDDGEEVATGAFVVLLIVAFTFNGFLGPVVEELYFRGHLLPRIERLGAGAPVLNTALFSLYHFWTPWQNPARIIGFLPMTWLVWRHRSIQISIAAHITINVVFLLLLLAAYLAES